MWGSKSRGTSNVHKSGLLLLGLCVSSQTVCPCQLRSPDEWRNVCGSQSQMRPWGSVKTPVSERDVWGTKVTCCPSLHVRYRRANKTGNRFASKCKVRSKRQLCILFPIFFYQFTQRSGWAAGLWESHQPHADIVWGCHLSAITKPTIMNGLQQYTEHPPPQDKLLQRIWWELLTQNNMELQTKPWENLEQRRTPCKKIHFWFFFPISKQQFPKNNDLGGRTLISV